MRLPIKLISTLTAFNNIYPNNYYPLSNNWVPTNNEDYKAYEEYCEIGAEQYSNDTVYNKTKKLSQKDKYNEILKKSVN